MWFRLIWMWPKQAAVPQVGHVGQELADAHQAAGVGVGQQLGDVARGARLPGLR